MLNAATIGLLLAFGSSAAPAPGKTLWVVQPLYPGQELLVNRTEEALRKLMADIPDQLIGTGVLAAHLRGRKADLRCLTAGDAACVDPVDSFVAALGFERVVMLRGGQEDAAYRYKTTSYVPATGEAAFAEGSGANLDRALLAALVKVVPLASTLEIASDPPGAVVLVDGEKVGVTPYAGQILPGERLVRIEAASHMPVQKTINIPVRGVIKLTESFERVPARLVVTAAPAGASIRVDGVTQGTDKIDQPIQPGHHQVDFALDGHVPLTEQIEIAPGAVLTLDRTLVQTGWTTFKGALTRGQENIYKRGASVQANYEWAQWHGDKLYAQQSPNKDFDNPDSLLARKLLSRSALNGVSFEYHQDGRYFGLMVVGAGYYTGSQWRYTLENGSKEAEQSGTPTLLSIRGVQPHVRFALWRLALYGQAGFDLRVLNIHPAKAALDQKDLWIVDLLTTAQVALRAYLVEGLFLEGAFRYSWAFFSEHAGIRGFHAGVGYAF